MAKILSINIDLRNFMYRIHGQGDSKGELINITSKYRSIVDYYYNHERLFLFSIFISALILLVVFVSFIDNSRLANKNFNSNTSQEHLIVKERHLTANTEPHQYRIYLNYEKINVLETFSFPIK